MSDVMVSGIIIGLLAMLLYTPYLMCKGIMVLDSEDGKLPFNKKVMCSIPIYNVIRAEITYYGKVKTVSISYILLLVCSVLRVFLWWNYYNNVALGTMSIILFYAALIFWFVSNMIFTYAVINDAKALTGFKLFLFSFAFPFGQYYIGTILVNIVRRMIKQEDTFKG